ncbi:MAG: hypothetical protein ABJM06_06065 [Gilvibacter sp.]
MTGLLYAIGLKNKKTAYKIFTFYLILIALIQLGSFYVGRGYLSKPNIFYSHFYYLGQFILLTAFFATLLNRKWLYWFLVPILAYAAFGFINDPGSFYRYNTVGMTLTHGLLVVYSVLYLYKSISDNGDFIIVSSGIFLYLLSSTLIFASQNVLTDLGVSREVNDILIKVNLILYLIFLILINIEWIKNYSLLDDIKLFQKLFNNGDNRR